MSRSVKQHVIHSFIPAIIFIICFFSSPVFSEDNPTDQDGKPVGKKHVRLRGGATSNEGRVELYIWGKWGTVCDDLWDMRDANVVCQQLGLGQATRAFGNAYFGEGTGSIHLDDVQCDGTETDILSCHHQDIGLHNCMHSEDAGVACRGTDCDRHDCKADDVRTCEYEWEVSYFYSMLNNSRKPPSRPCGDCPFKLEDCAKDGCIPLNGVKRPLVTVNRQVPGPNIVVCKNDIIKVHVKNKLDDMTGITFHWHGIHQRNTPYMDGPSMITQCPITYGSTFTYKFKADVAGTYFWHSHMASNRADGLAGALIIREPISEDINGEYYDYDLTEHILIIQDWMKVVQNANYLQYLYDSGPNRADFVLINGKGRGKVINGNQTAYTPREILQVEHGKKYRIRLISNAFTGCHLTVSVEGHRLTAIAMDGYPINKVEFDILISDAGERFDFILDANQPFDNYQLHVIGDGAPHCPTLSESATVQYTHEDETIELILTQRKDETNIVLNPAMGQSFPDALRMIDLDSHVEYIRPPNKKPTTYYLHLGVNDVHTNDSALRATLPQINHITFSYPPVPLLSQHQDIVDKDKWFCNDTGDAYINRSKECEDSYCSCAQVISANTDEIIELFFFNSEQSPKQKQRACHPMHLHGYSYRVVGMGELNQKYTLEEIIEKDRDRATTPFERRQDSFPLVKDTACVSHGSYLILQFVADNPGWWFLHCHLDFHAILGMAMVIQVGEDSDVDIPTNFPKCGDFSLYPSTKAKAGMA